jgi:hypothetical protein
MLPPVTTNTNNWKMAQKEFLPAVNEKNLDLIMGKRLV